MQFLNKQSIGNNWLLHDELTCLNCLNLLKNKTKKKPLETDDVNVYNLTKNANRTWTLNKSISPLGILVTNKIRQWEKKGRKSAPLIAEVHAGEHLLDSMAFLFPTEAKEAAENLFLSKIVPFAGECSQCQSPRGSYVWNIPLAQSELSWAASWRGIFCSLM